MNHPSQFLHRFRGPSQSLGFTLTELLLAAAIISSAVAVSGIGLTAIMSSSTSVNEGNERQDELNRALDFISAEIREAKKINDSSTDPVASIPTNPKVKAGTIEPILWLDTGSTNNIFYYLAEPADSNTFWRGNKVVYRWGPEFDENGTYKGRESHAVLIDSLRNETDSDAISCPASWDKFPETATNVGFYACVEENNRVANLFQVGQVNQVLEKSKPMLRERQVYSRSLDTLSSSAPLPQPPPCSVASGPSCSTPPPPCPVVSGPSCSTPPPPPTGNPLEITSSGYIVTRDLEELSLQHMGGDITCGSGGPEVPTLVTVLFERPNGQTFSADILVGSITRTDVPRGTQVRFRAKRDAVEDCGEYSVDSRFDLGTQILALDNEQSIPYYQPFDDQNKIDTFLSSHLNNDKISIGENQKIFLFELGEAYSSQPTSAYDFQDLVLMADMIPASVQINTTVGTNRLGEQTTQTTVSQTTSSPYSDVSSTGQ